MRNALMRFLPFSRSGKPKRAEDVQRSKHEPALRAGQAHA